MKKKILALVISILSALTMLTGCLNLNLGGPPSGGGGEDTPKENLIFDENSELNVIVGNDADNDLAAKLYEKLLYSKPTAGWKNSSAEKIEHEIVLGNDTGREITEAALMRLERMDDEKMSEDDLAYVIYSDGSSIAVVYEEDYDGAAIKFAFEAFIELVLDKVAYYAKAGVVESRVFNIVEDFYTPLDEAHRKEVLDAAEAKLGAESVNALKSMMGIYDERLIQWIAGLYDPCICVCKGMGEEECKNTEYCQAQGGGFYFSNSARDTVGFLPDLESTRQALDMLNMSGMTWMYGGNYYSGALPEGMMEAIGRYTRVLQSESDGYFRHPQWANRADFDMRLNRDLSWAMTLLNAAGMKPWYNTPTGVEGVGKPAASSSELTTNVHKSSPVAVSKVIAVSSYPAILESRETFQADLDENAKSIRTSSYGTGSRYATYLAQIVARDKEIGTPDDPTPLLDMLYNWYEENKNPERGTWVGDESYGGNPKQIGAYAETNGVMKIIGCYTNAKKPYSYGIEAMHACIDVLTTDEVPTGTVDIYNAWIALNGVYSAVKKYNSPDEQAAAEALMTEFRQNCVEEINASRDKMLGFKRADGSYSYTPTGGSGWSMGMPTQVPGTSEGDVNGALIASADCWGHICSSLGITKIPIFGAAEMYKFRKWIESNGSVIKQGTNLDYSVIDFEDDEIGEEPSGNLTFVNNSAGTSFLVAYDRANDNKYLEFISEKVTSSGGGNSITTVCESHVNTSAYVFEGDLCIKESADAYPCRIQFGSISYAIMIKIEGNKVKLIEQSSDIAANAIEVDLGADVNLGEWFRIKIVYYCGDHDSVRIKVYFDNLSDGEDELKLLAVSDNYWDQQGNKNNGNGNPKMDYSGTTLYALKSFQGVILLDNLAAYKTKETYTPETDPNDQPPYNVDPPESEEVKYDFEDGAISEGIAVNGSAAVVDGADGKELKLGASATLTIPITHRKNGAKCAGVYFDLYVPETAAKGDVFTITEREPTGNVFSLVFTVMEDGEGKYVTIREKGDTVGSILSTVRIPLGEKVNVAVDYHHNEDVAIIYVDGTFVAASGFIYPNGSKRTVKTLDIVTASGGDGITLDNIIFEKNLNSYLEATKPTVDSVIHTFDDSLGDGVKAENGAKRESYLGGYAVLVPKDTKAGSLTVKVNNRSNIYSLIRFSAAFSYQSANSNGEAHTVSFVDNDGNKIFALCFKIADSLVEVYEVGAGGVGKERLFSFKKTETAKISVDVYQSQRMAHIYLGDTCVAITSVFASEKADSATPATVLIEATKVKSKLYVDNLKFETLYDIYLKPEMKAPTNTDKNNPLTFDKSSTGSLPKDMLTNSQNLRVENLCNDFTGEFSNVGVLNTVKGKNETIGAELDKANSASCVTFETDFMIPSRLKNDGGLFQIFFTTQVTGNPASCSAYGMTFNKSGDGFFIANYCNTTKTTVTPTLSFDTWYRLKVEYYPTSDGEAKIAIYVNDRLEYVTDERFNASAPSIKDVKCVFLYTYLNTEGDIYVDNMSLTTSDAVCNESVGDK